MDTIEHATLATDEVENGLNTACLHAGPEGIKYDRGIAYFWENGNSLAKKQYRMGLRFEQDSHYRICAFGFSQTLGWEMRTCMRIPSYI